MSCFFFSFWYIFTPRVPCSFLICPADLSKVPDYIFGACDLFDGDWFLDTTYKKTAYDPSKCGYVLKCYGKRNNCGQLFLMVLIG